MTHDVEINLIQFDSKYKYIKSYLQFIITIKQVCMAQKHKKRKYFIKIRTLF